MITVNVDIFAQYIFSRRVLDARKYVSEKINHSRANRVFCHIRENLSMQKGHPGLGARKFSSAQISTYDSEIPTFLARTNKFCCSYSSILNFHYVR